MTSQILSSVLQQMCVVLLQRAEQGPQRWMLVANVARKRVIPAFAGVVCAFCPVDCGPVLIPHQCREGGWRASQLQQEVRRFSVTHWPQDNADVCGVEIVH